MTFQEKIYELEKNGHISRKPNPTAPFVLSAIYIIFSVVIYILHKKLHTLPLGLVVYGILGLTVFTTIFAILHLIVVRAIRAQEKKLGIISPKPKEVTVK